MVSTEKLVSILTGNTSSEAKQAIAYVNANPGLSAAERQTVLNSVPASAPKASGGGGGAPSGYTPTGHSSGSSYNPSTGHSIVPGAPAFVNKRPSAVMDSGGYATPGAPAPTAAPMAPPAAPLTPFVDPMMPGEMNVPFGSEYLDPALNLYGLLAQLQQQKEQFEATLGQTDRHFGANTLLSAGQALANLYAQGPQSAAELAFLQGGQGFPAIGGGRAAIESLIGSATRGATGSTSVDFPGGQGVSIPNTLGGTQMQGLQSNPNLAGVLESYAKAAGNPDLYARSIASLVPSAFRGMGSGF